LSSSRLLGAVCALTACIGLGSNKALAVGVPAGTDITNTAEVTYAVGATTATTISNAVVVKVAEILDVALPFVKARAVAVLSAPYTTNDEALAAIESELMNFYRTSYPDIFATRNDSVTAAVAEVKQIYQTYFFPEMKTDWKAHINNLGHLNAQGCFRCHDGQHVSSDGRVIRNDCSICHTTVQQSFGGVVFQPADGVFKHPVDLGDKNTWQCAACHKGDRAFKHPLNLGDISQFKCSECHTGGFDRVQY